MSAGLMLGGDLDLDSGHPVTTFEGSTAPVNSDAVAWEGESGSWVC